MGAYADKRAATLTASVCCCMQCGCSARHARPQCRCCAALSLDVPVIAYCRCADPLSGCSAVRLSTPAGTRGQLGSAHNAAGLRQLTPSSVHWLPAGAASGRLCSAHMLLLEATDAILGTVHDKAFFVKARLLRALVAKLTVNTSWPPAGAGGGRLGAVQDAAHDNGAGAAAGPVVCAQQLQQLRPR